MRDLDRTRQPPPPISPEQRRAAERQADQINRAKWLRMQEPTPGYVWVHALDPTPRH